MVKETAGFLIKHFVDDAKMEKEQLEICQYGMEIIVSTLVNIISVLLIGALGKAWVESVIFLIGFAVLRKWTGGYHAGSYLTCNLSLIICYGLLLWTYHTSVGGFGWAGLTAIFLVHFTIWYLYMPVEHENKPLDQEQTKRAKRYGCCISIVYGALSGLCLKIQFYPGLMLAYMIMLVDLLALAAVVKRRFHDHEGKKLDR